MSDYYGLRPLVPRANWWGNPFFTMVPLIATWVLADDYQRVEVVDQAGFDRIVDLLDEAGLTLAWKANEVGLKHLLAQGELR